MENKQDKGFTLVELLIVIVILGILATVTVLAVSGITDTAKENSCASDGATLQTAYESAYVLADGTVPSITELQAALSDNNTDKVAAAPVPATTNGVWAYTAPTATTAGLLAAPNDAPTTCEDIVLS